MKSIVRKSVVISCALLQSVCVIASDTLLEVVAAAAAPRLSEEPRIDSLTLDQQQRPPIVDAPTEETTLSHDLQAKLVKLVVTAMQKNGLKITQSGAAVVVDKVKEGCFTRRNKKTEKSSIKQLVDASTSAANSVTSAANSVGMISRSPFSDKEGEAFKEADALEKALSAFDGIPFNDVTTPTITGFFNGNVTFRQVLTPLITPEKRTRFVIRTEKSPESKAQELNDTVKQAVVQAIEVAVKTGQIDEKVALQESLKKQTAHVATQAVAAGLMALGTVTGLSLPAGLLAQLAPVVVAELIAGSQFVIEQVGKSSCCRKLKQKPPVVSLVALQQAGDNSLVSQPTTDSEV